MDDRIELVRQALLELDIGDEWESVVEDGIPPALAALQSELVDAYRRGDVEWLLEHTDPDAEIVQLQELPDARTYHGRDGLLDALLDWPGEWEDFHVEPRRVFAVGDDQVVTVTVHRGRPRTIEIEVEAEIVWLMRWRDRRMTRWAMFKDVEEALEAAR